MRARWRRRLERGLAPASCVSSAWPPLPHTLTPSWAAKEAAFKALPPRTLSGWKDLELAYAASGRPSLVLVWEAREGGRAVGAGSTAVNTTDVRTRADGDAQEAQGISLLPTLSHDAGVLVAAVVAQREGGR